MAEITFEVLALGLETAAGTRINPTHYMNAVGTLSNRFSVYAPDEQRGTFVAGYRSTVTRRWGEFSGEGPLDNYLLPVLLQMVAKGGVTSPTTPGGGTNSRLWTFVPTLNENDLKTATIYWGDANVQVLEGTYGHIQEMTISNDASSADGARMSITGMTQNPTYRSLAITGITAADPPVVTTSAAHGLADGAVVYIEDVGGMTEVNDIFFTVDSASGSTFELLGIDGTGYTAYTSGGTARVVAPAFPAFLESPLFIGQNMQVWLDSGGDAIGTTAINGRVVSAEHVLPVNYVQKYLANGPASDGSFYRLGRNKRRMTTRVTMELLDLDQYTLFAEDTSVKLRVRHNGPLIEGSLYHYVEVDTYGPLRMTDWGELESVNRTISFEIMSEYDSDLGADFRIAVQNDRASL